MKKKSKALLKDKKTRKDPRIQEVYEQEVEFNCPIRGKIKQKVKIKRYKAASDGAIKHVLNSSDSIDKLDEQDDGLSIYSDGEELGVDDGNGTNEEGIE